MKINKNPSSFEIRRFAAFWACASALTGGIFLWRHHPSAAHGFWTASATVAIFGAFIPSLARSFYRGWMTLTEGINFLITHFFLLIIFYGVLTPLAVVFKLSRRDALGLKKSSFPSESYWKNHERIPDASYYNHLY